MALGLAPHRTCVVGVVFTPMTNYKWRVEPVKPDSSYLSEQLNFLDGEDWEIFQVLRANDETLYIVARKPG